MDEGTKDDRVWLDRRPVVKADDEDGCVHCLPYWDEMRVSEESDRRLSIQMERIAAWQDLLGAGINERAVRAISDMYFHTGTHQNFKHKGLSFKVLVRQNLLSCIEMVSANPTVPFSHAERARAIEAVTGEIDNIWGGRPLVNRYDWKGIPRSLIPYPGASWFDVDQAVNCFVYKSAWWLIAKTAPLAANGHYRADSLEIFMIYCHYESAMRIERFYYNHPEMVRSVLGVSSLVCPYFIDTQKNWQKNTHIGEKAWYSAKDEFNALIRAGMPADKAHRYSFTPTDLASPVMTEQDAALLKTLKHGRS